MTQPSETATTPRRPQPRTGKPRKEVYTVWLPIIVLCLVGLVVTWVLFVGPPPPKTIKIATGSEGGAYTHYAKRYAEVLRRDYDLNLEIVTTKGSGDNLRRLMDPNSGVDLAFVQSGLVKSGAAPKGAQSKLLALGSVYREPLWVFHRGAEPIHYLRGLSGKRVAIGVKGSGTRAVVDELFKSNGDVLKSIQIVEVTSDADATDKFLAGSLDAVFLVASPAADYVRRIVDAMDTRKTGSTEEAQRVHLLSLARAGSYSRTFRYLSDLEVNEGLLSLPGNVPDRPAHVLSPAAMLVASPKLHPSLVTLLLDVAGQVNAADRENVIDAPGEFPTKAYVDLPIHRDASRYYKHGKSFLFKVLPFWLANTLDRLKVMLVPLLTLLFPLFKVGPPVLRWQIRSRIYKWYELIREADVLIASGASIAELEEEQRKLQEIAAELPKTEVPLSYMEEFYHLRLHMDFIQQELDEALQKRESRLPPSSSDA